MPDTSLARAFGRLRYPIAIAICLVVLNAALLARAGAQEMAAADDTAPAVTTEQLADLVSTLETPEDRERFLAELKALIAAQQAREKATKEPSEGASALKGISDAVGRVGDELVSIAKGLGAIPKATGWLGDQWSEPETRDVWVEVIWNLAVVIGGGLLAGYLIAFGLRHPRRLLEQHPRPSAWLRPLMLLGYNLLRLVPAVGFAGVSYGLLTVLDPSEVTRLIALSAINAHVIASVVKTIANQGLAAWSPNLRLAPISDETAMYCTLWWRRLVNITVYGYFVCQAALLLGLPELGYDAIVKILGIIVVALLIVLILQNRVPFAKWVRSAGVDPRLRVFLGAVYRVADFWHILAISYILAGAMLSAAEGLNGFLFFLKSSVASIAIIWASGFALVSVKRAVTRGFRVRAQVAERHPGLQARVNRYLPIARSILQVIILLLAFTLVLEAWNVDVFTWLASETGRIIIGRVAAIVAIAVIALIVWEIASTLIDRYLQATDEAGQAIQRGQRVRTLLPLARNAFRVVIGVVAILMILTEIGINIAPILAGVGVIGLAIGFGAQTLVKDIITGVFILLEDSIAVGDVVSVGSKTGLVETISIRTVRMRDLTGNVHTIPYSAIDTVTNMTKEFSYYLIEAGVAYRENYDEVADVMREVGEELRNDPEWGQNFLEPIEILGLDRFADSAVIIRARIKTVPLKQWATGREYNRRLKAAFDAHGIEIPFPHQTIYFGEDKKGQAPPAFITMVDPAEVAERSGGGGVAETAPAAAGGRAEETQPRAASTLGPHKKKGAGTEDSPDDGGDGM